MGHTIGIGTYWSSALGIAPLRPAFGHLRIANLKRKRMSELPVATTLKFVLPMITTSDCEFTKRNLGLLCVKLGRSVAAHSIEKRRLNIVTKGSSNPMGQ